MLLHIRLAVISVRHNVSILARRLVKHTAVKRTLVKTVVQELANGLARPLASSLVRELVNGLVKHLASSLARMRASSKRVLSPVKAGISDSTARYLAVTALSPRR